MQQRSVYDTPPDGDFARYVEELGRRSSVRLPQGAAPGAQDVAPAPRAPPRSGRAPSSEPAAGMARAPAGAHIKAQLVQLFQWGFAAVVVFMLASAAYPPLAVAAVPLLLAFGALAWLRLRPLPWSEMVTDARQRTGLALHPSDPGAASRPSRPPK